MEYIERTFNFLKSGKCINHEHAVLLCTVYDRKVIAHYLWHSDWAITPKEALLIRQDLGFDVAWEIVARHYNLLEHFDWKNPELMTYLIRAYGNVFFPIETFGLDSSVFEKQFSPIKQILNEPMKFYGGNVRAGGSYMIAELQKAFGFEVKYEPNDVDIFMNQMIFNRLLTSKIITIDGDYIASITTDTGKKIQFISELYGSERDIVRHDMDIAHSYHDLRSGKTFMTLSCVQSHTSHIITQYAVPLPEKRLAKYMSRGFQFESQSGCLIPTFPDDGKTNLKDNMYSHNLSTHYWILGRNSDETRMLTKAYAIPVSMYENVLSRIWHDRVGYAHFGSACLHILQTDGMVKWLNIGHRVDAYITTGERGHPLGSHFYLDLEKKDIEVFDIRKDDMIVELVFKCVGRRAQLVFIRTRRQTPDEIADHIGSLTV